MIKIILLLLLFCSFIYSQQQEPIVTDRPDITESALTVPKSSFQVETGFVLQNSSEETEGATLNVRDVSFLTTLLRYGLFESLELRLGSGYLYQKTELGESSNAEGLNGLLFGTKIQLLRDNSSFPDAALFIHLNIPLGNEDFQADNIEPEVLLAFAHGLTEMFALSYNLGGTWSSTEEQIYYFYSISLAAPLSEKLGSFIEFFGETASGSGFSTNIDGGLTYLIENNFQIDISAGIDLDKAEDNWFLSTGVSFRLPE